MLAPALRRQLVHLRQTPLHPQWLMGGRRVAEALVRLRAFGVVLDIGCADRWVHKVLPPGCQYVGIDFPGTGKVLYEARPDVFADAARLPLEDSAVDTVVLLDVLEHVSRPREALAEAARVLRPGGVLLLTMPFMYPVHDAPYDFQRYTTHGLAREASDAGLSVEMIAPTMGALQTAGLAGCLALSGVVLETVRQRRWTIIAIPLLICVIPVINLAAGLLGHLFPTWAPLTAGYSLVARKA